MSRNMVYSAYDISRYIINESIDDHNPITNLKLQKILYYVKVNFLISQNRDIFIENILNWRHGPVIRESYEVFKGHGTQPIKDKVDSIIEFNIDTLVFEEIKDDPVDKISFEDQLIIKDIILSYSFYNAWKMVDKCNKEEPVQNKNNKIITNELIIDFYSKNPELILGNNI